MRNLQLRKHHVLSLPSAKSSKNSTTSSPRSPSSSQPSPPPTAACWDGDSIIFTCGPDRTNPLLSIRRWKPVSSALRLFPSLGFGQSTDTSQLVTSFDAPCPLPTLACDRVLSVCVLPEKSALCLVLAGGDLILVREQPNPGEEKIEIVGSVEVGLLAAEWAPDGELLALATRTGTLLLMTRELESVSAPVEFGESDLEASKHVDVGWGKKETQFKGRGARALRDPTMPEIVDQGLRSDFDFDDEDDDGGIDGEGNSERQGRTTISWRGDGAFLAVNSRLPNQRRVLRVYSREGVLDGVSEPVDYLEAALSWRPAGNLMASVQRRAKEQVDVVFFERNGLRHGEFSLRPTPKLPYPNAPDPTSQILLHWNCDSTILAVCFADRIQLWTMGNYHYYLKQEIIMFDDASPDHTPPVISWHLEHPLKYVLIPGGTAAGVEMRQYAQVVSRSPTWSSQTGTVAVIDGRTLKLTSLRYANVPPPMAQDEFTLEDNVKVVAIYTAGAEERIAVVHGSVVSLLLWKPQAKDHVAPKLLSTVKLPGSAKYSNYRSIAFTNESTVLIAGSSLLRVAFQEEKGGAWTVVGEAEKFTGNVLTVEATTVDDMTLEISRIHKPLMFGRDGDIMKLDGDGTDTGESSNWLCQLPKDADTVEAVSLAHASPQASNSAPDAGSSAAETIVFGMTRGGGLYANKTNLARDCTSFVVTSAHLVYTTTKHLLKFVHLGPVDELVIPSDTPEVDERCRAVERGAKLVSIIPSTGAVILQMPRGNLETIFPRALVLAEIRRNIDDKKYRKAFLNCRKQRVDMNIIYDYKPQQLLDNVALFVDQVKKVEHIDLFLSQLRDEDVSVSMYKDTLPKKEAEQIAAKASAASITAATGKTNEVCNAFLPVLRERASTNLQNIITAHVVKNPPDIDAGLLEVAKMHARSEEEGSRGVEHICFLVDVNRLYDNALGLYDLHLTLQIADKSQKDPREFMPFLQRLHDLPEGRRKFEIDDCLFRHRKALADLWELDAFEEYKQYAVKHALYDDALHACRYSEPRYRAVMSLYATHLQKENKHREAGIALEYLQSYSAASECYQLAHLWRESLACASLSSDFDAPRLRALASLISESLVEHKEFAAAAAVARDYLSDDGAAARLFCRGYCFADAIALLSLRSQSNRIPEIVDTGLTECMGATTELLADCKAQLNAQVPRIRELRVKKAEEPLAYYEGSNLAGTAGAGGADNIPDDISLATTNVSTMGGNSLFTRYTGKNSGTIATNATRKTAKNRRKEERKRAQGKKGSVYEEEYLVNSVGRLMDRVNGSAEDVERLMVGLMRRGMRERARAVDEAMREVLGMCVECRHEVFGGSEGKLGGSELRPVSGASPGMEGVGPEQQQLLLLQTQNPGQSRQAPVMCKWEGLSMLGRR